MIPAANAYFLAKEMRMAGTGEPTGDRALWARWRAATPAPASEAEPDALSLAAYAEGRLDEPAAEAIERWLAEHPERLAELAVARAAETLVPPPAPEPLIAQASALVAAGDERVVRLRRSRPPIAQSGWRAIAVWGGLAASIVATSLIGFQLGSDAYANFTVSSSTASVQQDVLDPPGSGILPSADEEDAGT